MAVYYIDPYTTTNGSGTWASPWSFNSSTRTGFANGDELRIVARLLTDLLTATTYTASRPAVNQVTITSGGGLGADFVVGDMLYFPDYDSFGYVNSKSTNTLTMTAGSPVPIPTTQAMTINVRRMPVANCPPSATSTSLTLLGQSYNNITVTDGWTADGVQVTDGTAKSIVRSSYTASSVSSFFIDSNVSPQPSTSITSFVVNASNTHVLGMYSSAAAFQIYIANATSLTFAQFLSNSGGSTINTFSTNSVYKSATNYTIKHLTATGGSVFSSAAMAGGSLTITNLYLSTHVVFGTRFVDTTVNITTLVFATLTNPYLAVTTSTPSACATYNIGTIDIYIGLSLTGITGAFGAYVLNITGPIYVDRRNTTLTSVTSKFYQTTGAGIVGSIAYIPTIAATGITSSADIFNNNPIFQAPSTRRPYNFPAPYQLFAAESILVLPGWGPNPANLLVTYRDGSAPIEILGVQASPNPIPSTVTAAELPNAYLDATVFRTTGPSIEVYLATYTTSIWVSPLTSFGTKLIRIPVVFGTTYTISGYIRTDDATFTDGQCIVSLTNGFTTSNTQSMTTACINAWEQFSFTYAATITQEIYLAVSMQFSSGAKSFWIDDITIV